MEPNAGPPKVRQRHHQQWRRAIDRVLLKWAIALKKQRGLDFLSNECHWNDSSSVASSIFESRFGPCYLAFYYVLIEKRLLWVCIFFDDDRRSLKSKSSCLWICGIRCSQRRGRRLLGSLQWSLVLTRSVLRVCPVWCQWGYNMSNNDAGWENPALRFRWTNCAIDND